MLLALPDADDLRPSPLPLSGEGVQQVDALTAQQQKAAVVWVKSHTSVLPAAHSLLRRISLQQQQPLSGRPSRGAGGTLLPPVGASLAVFEADLSHPAAAS